jgi:hypothetical protein
MPWRECCKMDERLRFVARLLEGEKMAVLCREFDISRKTGYKIFARYKDCGVEGLTDRSRRPYRHANRLPLRPSYLCDRNTPAMDGSPGRIRNRWQVRNAQGWRLRRTRRYPQQ